MAGTPAAAPLVIRPSRRLSAAPLVSYLCPSLSCRYSMKRGHHYTPGPLRRPRAPPARNPAAAAAADALMALMPLLPLPLPLIPLMPLMPPPSSFSSPGNPILNCVAPTLAHQISPPAGYLGRYPRTAKPESCKVFMAPRRNSR